MALGVGVHPQEEVELTLAHLDGAVQVATLEQTIEHPLALAQVGVHPLERPVEQSRPIVAVAPQLLLQAVRLDYLPRVYAVAQGVAILGECGVVCLLLVRVRILPVQGEGVDGTGPEVVDAEGVVVIEASELFRQDLHWQELKLERQGDRLAVGVVAGLGGSTWLGP